ncbi:hypothetical protein SUGI_0844060 [Cryptomeria japonica]|uniref:origin of replication complex subunit 2 n=1 Tax=Cryptomeria japonica TaxID=3369 RepID=UPI00241499BE|nr:origin of replication complex subunit 2 [Cryptomeria japonica]GLJ40804.1 hypothetical protein SUGI_0844060 [Cryptomeria japonica]
MAPKTAKRKQRKAKFVSSPETLSTSKKLKTSKGAHPTATATDEEGELDARILEAVEGLGVSDGEEEDLGFSRNYFIAKEANGLGNKSRKKIADIDLVDEQELRAALLALVPKHEKEQAALVDSYKSLYSKWHFQLRCGFGLLMYGFGSKRNLLEDFASSTLTDGGVVVINGYLPSINIKHVISTIAEVLWDQMEHTKKSSTRSKSNSTPPFSSQTLEEIIIFLSEGSGIEDDCVVYVLVHNIDGPSLRENEIQQYLATLAACSRVHFVASIDHVNAPLLWDKQMARAQFNWWWYHTPTYASYNVEGTFMPLILASTGAVQSARTAAIVLQSLTPNAQSVFKVLAEYQLEHPEEQGLPVQRLYTLCREQFLVSSQVTLNSHLTEFKDHELVRTRRGADGQDCLYIPFPSEALTKLLQDITS